MRTLSVSFRFNNYKFEPLKIFLSLAVLPFQTFAISGHKNRTKKSRKSGLFGPSFCEKSDYLIKNNEFRFDIPVVSKSICSMEIPLQ